MGEPVVNVTSTLAEAATGVEGTHAYQYDVLGRRVRKTTGGTGASDTVFVRDGQTVAAEYTATSAAASPLRKYVNASYVDEPVLLIDRTASGSVGAGTDERFYYHRNQQYSITALTDNSGAVTERYAYTAYGEPTILDGPGTTTRTTSFINNPYLYTAQEYDAETGLYHFNARMYEGRKGRFLSHDPIMYPDGPITYGSYFCNSETDPEGLCGGPPSRVKCGNNEYDPRGRQACCWKYSFRPGSRGSRIQVVESAQLYTPATQCCVDGVVETKSQTVYIVNRSGGQRTGPMGGHIDLVIPGSGMVGYFGGPNGGSGNGYGIGMAGNLNITYADWTTGFTKRPEYTLGNSRGGVLSTICELKRCPSQIASMNTAVAALNASPGYFNLTGNNCADNGCRLLGAGGVMVDGISGINNPENLLDQLQSGWQAACYTGYTAMTPAGVVTVTRTGPTPVASP